MFLSLVCCLSLDLTPGPFPAREGELIYQGKEQSPLSVSERGRGRGHRRKQQKLDEDHLSRFSFHFILVGIAIAFSR